MIFLNDPHNHTLLRDIITSGNTSFRKHYCITRPTIAVKCYVLELYRLKLLGSDRDVERMNISLQHFWAEIEADDTSNAPPINLYR